MEITEAVLAALGEAHTDRSTSELAAQTNLPEAAVLAALASLADAGQVTAVSGSAWVSGAAWNRLVATATKTLETFHRRSPYKAALSYGDLRAALQKAATVREGDALFNRLAERGVLARTPAGVTLPGFAIVLPPKWEDAAEKIVPVFVGGGLTDPPWHGNFQAHYPRDVPVPALLDALCERGELTRLSPDLYVATESVTAAEVAVSDMAADKPFTIGAVRDATGASRRIVIALLEYWDKRGVTVRDGDTRRFA
ncbi:MAG: SelB C-terminal domain-containing protein [Armatimonadetes bacterium]|nr:SelB C-terminal domain-containing protein [Armatimonadota bacterium]